jgi:hypothetical protein
MFKKDGSPRFKYVVEGANLFFSEGARFIITSIYFKSEKSWSLLG